MKRRKRWGATLTLDQQMWVWQMGDVVQAGHVGYPDGVINDGGPFRNPARMCEAGEELAGVWACAGWWDR